MTSVQDGDTLRQPARPGGWLSRVESAPCRCQPGHRARSGRRQQGGSNDETDGVDVIGSTPEQTAALLASEVKKCAVVIRERNMRAE